MGFRSTSPRVDNFGSTRFGLGVVHVAPVLLPYVAHITERRIVKEHVLGTSFLCNRFGTSLQILTLAAIRYNLLFFGVLHITSDAGLE